MVLSELEVLVELQELDTRIGQLFYRSDNLPEHEQLMTLKGEDATLQSAIELLLVDLEVLRKDQQDREDEIQLLEDKVAKATSSLYAGDMTSPKDATALQNEIDSLAGRQNILEDQIIELMEQIEPLAAEESRLLLEQGACRTAMGEAESKISEQQAELVSQANSLTKEKEAVFERAGTTLTNLYVEHRSRMGDHTAVGRLVGASCGACFLEISAVEVDRIRRLPNGEPSECPECGALLVR